MIQFHDLKFAFRQLRKSPGFTIVAVLSLALGIGANTAVFSVVDAVLLKALPYDEPDQLVRLSIERRGRSGSVSYPIFNDWREQSDSYSHLTAFKYQGMDFISDKGPESLTGACVSQGFFKTLGIQAAMGRTFVQDEDSPGANPVIVISHRLWSRYLGEDPTVLGQSLRLDDNNYSIVGVLPRGFQFALMEDTEFWIPLTDRLARTDYTYQVIGRLKPGVSLAQSQVEMKIISDRLLQTYPKQTAGPGQVGSLSDYITGRSRVYLLVLLGAITFVLLIACANVANLVLARSTLRTKELALRQALGAGWWRISRQVLTENILLSLMGGAAGLLMAHWLSSIIRTYLVSLYVPRAGDIAVDIRVLGFAFGLALMTGLLIGLAPVFRLRCRRLHETLMERSSQRCTHHRMSDALIVMEVSAALILFIGAVLMMQTFKNLSQEDPGFQTDQLLTFKLELPRSRYANNSQRFVFSQRALQRLAALPGVESTAIDSHMPFGRRTSRSTVTLCGHPESDDRYQNPLIHNVTPSYFSTLRVSHDQGRLFTEQDQGSQLRRVVINQTMAQLAWPNENPVGRHILRGGHQTDNLEKAYEVIGVVADVHHGSLTEEIHAGIYFLHSAMAAERNLGFILRTQADPLSLMPAVRSILQELDPALPISELTTMNERIAETYSQQRFSLVFLGIAGGVALILVVVGVFGVASYVVSQRTQELGIRMALGASQGHIITMILSKGLILAALGSILGIAGALGLTRFLSAGLYGVSSTDPKTFVIATSLLIAVTLLACYIPARRAAKIDPMEALRYE
ncbi:ABC transporter permease [Planctomycetota bacterium]